jgi:hypothetical protein
MFIEFGCIFLPPDFLLLHKEFRNTDKAGTCSWRYVPCWIVVPRALLTWLSDYAFSRFLSGGPVVLLDFHHHFEALGFYVIRKHTLDIVVEFQLFSAHDTPLDVIVSLTSFIPIRFFSALG